MINQIIIYIYDQSNLKYLINEKNTHNNIILNVFLIILIIGMLVFLENTVSYVFHICIKESVFW